MTSISKTLSLISLSLSILPSIASAQVILNPVPMPPSSPSGGGRIVCQTRSGNSTFEGESSNINSAQNAAINACTRAYQTNAYECQRSVVCQGGGGGYPNYPSNPYPSGPSYPGTPGGYPNYPTNPGYPNYPTNPGYPNYPTNPSYPSNPGYPNYPTNPGYPNQPSYPSQPSQMSDDQLIYTAQQGIGRCQLSVGGYGSACDYYLKVSGYGYPQGTGCVGYDQGVTRGYQARSIAAQELRSLINSGYCY